MANEITTKKSGLFGSIGMSARGWINKFVKPATSITEADAFIYDGGTSISSLLGSGRRIARSRAQIYQKWSYMEGDPIISSALTLLVTSALGGHETTGDTVFIEKTPETQKDKRLSKIVDEITADLSDLLNRVAHTSAYNGAAFGDSYARIYADSGGVKNLLVDSLVRPTLVQPYEKAGQTVGFVIYSGEKMLDRLDISQMARLKMPRTLYVPQMSVIEKAFRMALREDDPDKLPILPSEVGGSFLYQAEEPYDNLNSSLLGLVGQRWMDSIDEQMVGVNMESMTAGQQEQFLNSIINMLKLSKQRAEDAVRSGQPVMERIRHIIPFFSEKQVVNLSQGPTGSSGRGATISIEDVMLHAKLVGGALGVDISMIGFAEQLSGGLGDGGFFRMSAQVAEKSRLLRGALADFFNSIIDIHTLNKYGMVFDPKNRPWNINFYGSISAMEAEKQRTRSDAMQSGSVLIQAMQQMREAGMDKKTFAMFLSQQMGVDEDQAKIYSSIVDAAPPQTDDFGSGRGGGNGGDDDEGGSRGSV